MKVPEDFINYHDFLAVAEKISLVAMEEQPKISQMLDALKNTSGPFAQAYQNDAEVLENLLDAQDGSSLKDFLMLRAMKQPSQTLEEIVGFLSNKKIDKIDEAHLLLNLLHFHMHPKSGIALSIYDISTILEHYAFTKMFTTKPELERYNLEFVPTTEPMWQQRIRITKKNANISSFLMDTLNEVDGVSIFYIHPDYEEKEKVNGESVYYTTPTAMLAQNITKSKDTSYELPLPMLLCYNYEIMQQYIMRSSQVYFRPVTLPTFLPLSIRNFFKGVRNVYGDAVYDSYNPFPTNPTRPCGLMDLKNVHENPTSFIGVLGHDHSHIYGDNRSSNTRKLCFNLNNALEANSEWSLRKLNETVLLDDKPSELTLFKLKFRQEMLDGGIIGGLINAYRDNPAHLANKLVEIADMLNHEDRDKFINVVESLDIPSIQLKSKCKARPMN
jgi:hypothetical protein